MKIEITVEILTENVTPSGIINAMIKELQVMPQETRIDGSSCYEVNNLRLSIRRDEFINHPNPYFS